VRMGSVNITSSGQVLFQDGYIASSAAYGFTYWTPGQPGVTCPAASSPCGPYCVAVEIWKTSAGATSYGWALVSCDLPLAFICKGAALTFIVTLCRGRCKESDPRSTAQTCSLGMSLRQQSLKQRGDRRVVPVGLLLHKLQGVPTAHRIEHVSGWVGGGCQEQPAHRRAAAPVCTGSARANKPFMCCNPGPSCTVCCA
jgi:hypothetical protein